MYNPLKQRHKHKGFWGTVVGAALGGLGAAASGAFSAGSARDQTSFQKDALQNRHQWEVEDLKKAGLNPILSAGSNPPVPTGAKYDMPNMGTAAMQGATVASNVEKTEKETDLIEAQTASAKNAAEISRYDAIERGLQHRQHYGDFSSAAAASEVSDYPRAIKGPARTVFSAADSRAKQVFSAVQNKIQQIKNYFKKARARTTTATEKQQIDEAEKKLIERLMTETYDQKKAASKYKMQQKRVRSKFRKGK